MFTLNHTKLNKEITITSYGKSMYGGWYANYRYEDADGVHYNGFGAPTLKELCAHAMISRTALTRDVVRNDN